MRLRLVSIAATAALGGLLFGYNTGVISAALLFLKAAFHLSAPMLGLVTSAALGGAAAGTLVAGVAADRYGRRCALLGTALIFIGGATLSSLATTVLLLVSGRFLTGIGIGAASMLAPLYLSEIAPSRLRGRLVSFSQLAMTLGILLSNLVGYGFAAGGAWRWMFGLGAVPAVMLAAGTALLPETPGWLASKGRFGEASDALQRLRGKLADSAREMTLLRAQFEDRPAAPAAQNLAALTLARRANRLPVVIGVVLAIFQQATGINTVIYFAPVIFQAAGLSSASAAILATAGLGVVNVAMTVLALRLIDRAGRRPLLLAGLLGMGISLGMLGGGFALGRNAALGWITAASLSAYIGCFAIGLGPVFWLLIAEMFPPAIRARGMSAATTANWLANLLVALSFLSLIDLLGRSGVFFLYAALAFGALLFSAWFVPETKDLDLAEVEKLWAKRE